MKVLGISFGRVNKNCDILVKQALLAAREAGAEVKFINTMKMDIQHCTGCGACSKLRDKGKQIKCHIKDDYLELEEAILEADGIVVAVPIYSLAPTGQFFNYIGRFGAAHDRAAALAEQNKRIREGAEELLDPRVLSDKYVAYISVGGAKTPNWVSFGLPTMHLFGMSTVMKTVGQINAYNMGTIANPVLEDELMEKTAQLGKHLAKSIGKPYEQVEWLGEEGVCPVCHNTMITVGATTEVECPICGIAGKLTIENDAIKVTFSEKEKKRARNTLEGLHEHYLEIQGFVPNILPKLQANKEKLETMMPIFENFESTY